MRSSQTFSVRGNRVFVVAMSMMVALMIVTMAEGNAFRNPPPSAAGLALDGGQSVLVDDASAVAINPANIVGLKGNNIMGSVTIVDAETDYTSALGSFTTDNDIVALPNFFAVIPMKEGKYMAGLGVTTPYGQATEWSEAGPVQPYLSEMMMINISPTIAMNVSDKVAVGVGADIYTSTLELRQPGMTVKGEGEAIGANLGVTCDFMEKQKLTLTYTSPFEIEYEGDTEIAGLPKDDFESEIEFPTVIVLGWGMQVSDKIAVASDVEWVEFSRNESIPLDYGIYNDPANPLMPSRLPQNWDDIWTYGVAGTYQASETTVLRASYKFLESPVPDETHTVSLPDADKHIIGLGLGWKKGSHVFDVGYAYSMIEDRDVAVGGPYDGEYDLESSLGSISYSYSF